MGIVRDAFLLSLPHGPIWRFVGDAALFFDGLSKNGQRIKERIDAIRKESLPSTATETLREWHHALGIAYDPTLPLARQRAMLDAILTAQGNSTRNGLAYQVAKEYVGLTVGENSGADLPDDPAGVTYSKASFANTSDFSSVVNCALTVSGGKLICTVSAANPRFQLAIAGWAGKLVRIKIKKTSASATESRLSSSGVVVYTFNKPYASNEHIQDAFFPSDAGGNIVINPAGSLGANGDVFEISALYIGTGAYLPNRYSIKGQVERVQDARRLGAIAAHFAPLHLLPTILGYTAQVAGNANPIPVNPTLDDPSIISVNRIARCGVATCGLARCGKAS